MIRQAALLLLLPTVLAHATPAEDLGRAYDDLRAGRFSDAYSLAAPLAVKNQDYALYITGQAAILNGDPASALPRFQQLTQKTMGDSRFHAIAAWRVADCLWALDKPADARKAYQAAMSNGEGDLGIALDRIGLADARAGDAKGAQLVWRRLAVELPEHPLADEARLATPLTPRERISRAQHLSENRFWDEALVELAQVPDTVDASTKDLRDYWIGMTYFTMRKHYDRAADLLLGVYPRMGDLAPKAMFHGARSLSRADKDEDAVVWYLKLVKTYPGSDYASQAQFLAGWLDFNDGRYEKGIPALQGTLDKFGGSRWADDALWYLAYSYYLLGDWAHAAKYLARYADKPGELVGAKGHYWHARVLVQLGKPDDARAELRAIVTTYPFSWYALLARARLAEDGITVGPFGDRQLRPGDAPDLAALDPSLASDARIARTDELLAAGMGVEAGAELERVERSFIHDHGAKKALPILFDRYVKGGDWERPYELGESYGGAAFDLPPDGAARSWWENAYPQAYRDLIEKYRDLGKNPPYYLYSIMRKESGYNPHDVSFADAIGLLQMIPPTTRRVVLRLGMQYSDDLLYDPAGNIETGAWYIGNLLNKFLVQIPIGAGSFNCGPKPVMKWVDTFGDRPIDEFVERVPYTETREYMKKVTSIYARYLYLYAGTDYVQPLAIDRAYVKNEIDY